MGTSPTKKGLNIIIVGCGKVGLTLTEQLSKEGHDITVIDCNSQKVQEACGLYDVMGVTGNGASYSVQNDAGITDTDLLIAVTGSDELNLLCCTIAKQVGECSTIARVRTPEYIKDISYIREKLGLAMVINPEMEAARETARIISFPNALEVTSFAHGQAELMKFRINEGNMLDGMTVAELGKRKAAVFLISAVEREGEVFIPSGDFRLQKGDIVSFVSSRKVAKSFFAEIGFKSTQIKNTMIIGGGKAAYYLAGILLNMGIDVKIIESDKDKCEELSILLPKATIINGDGTDQELLKEEGIEYVDSFVPLTGIDEENIMLTLYARQVSDAKAITKVNRMTFRNVISKLDIGSVVYPRLITSEAIIAYVRAKNASRNSEIETLYHLLDSKAEALEFRVKEASDVTDVPLMELPLKKNVLISFISRNGSIIIPTGKDCIKVGDTVMIVTTHMGFNNIQDILE